MIADFLEIAGNRLLEFDAETAQRISELRGKVLKLEVLVVNQGLYFVPTDRGVQVTDKWAAEADITLRGSPIALAQFGLKQKGISSSLFLDRRVDIEGDVELAQDFQRILGELDVDFEEMLSRYLGDIAARQLNRGVRSFRNWAREVSESLRSNVGEYLVEEARLLAPAWRIDRFIESTDVLRADVERLEQRVRRLQHLME